MAGRISSFFQSVKQNSCEILQDTIAVRTFLFNGDAFFPNANSKYSFSYSFLTTLKINILPICIGIYNIFINPQVHTYCSHTKSYFFNLLDFRLFPHCSIRFSLTTGTLYFVAKSQVITPLAYFYPKSFLIPHI